MDNSGTPGLSIHLEERREGRGLSARLPWFNWVNTRGTPDKKRNGKVSLEGTAPIATGLSLRVMFFRGKLQRNIASLDWAVRKREGRGCEGEYNRVVENLFRHLLICKGHLLGKSG